MSPTMQLMGLRFYRRINQRDLMASPVMAAQIEALCVAARWGTPLEERGFLFTVLRESMILLQSKTNSRLTP
jgi:hypothetical protein